MLMIRANKLKSLVLVIYEISTGPMFFLNHPVVSWYRELLLIPPSNGSLARSTIRFRCFLCPHVQTHIDGEVRRLDGSSKLWR